MQSKPLIYTAFIWLVYEILTWLAPVNLIAQSKYQISEFKLKLIGLTITIPILIIWLLSVYGANAVRRYAVAIQKSKDGKGYYYLSIGIFALVFQLIASSFISLIIRFSPDYEKGLRIFSVYESALLALLAFGALAYGSKKLIDFAGFNKESRKYYWIPIIAVGLIGVLYTKAILANKYRLIAPEAGSQSTYGVSDNFIFMTIVPIYILAWFAGLYALTNVIIFQNKIKGIIYKQSFKDFAFGFGLIIGMSIALQFFSQASSYFVKISLSKILLILYAIIVVIVVGYVCIARGAKKLLKLESV